MIEILTKAKDRIITTFHDIKTQEIKTIGRKNNKAKESVKKIIDWVLDPLGNIVELAIKTVNGNKKILKNLGNS